MMPVVGYWNLRRTPAHSRVRIARDLLLRHRRDLDTAVAEFSWPRPPHFNWALEWFDVIAADSTAPALVLLDDDGAGTDVSYARLRRDSDAVANWLHELGVVRGEHVLIALEQRLELWTTILACLKIGAVVIPTYPELSGPELTDRLTRGRVRHLVCEPAVADGLDQVDGLDQTEGAESTAGRAVRTRIVVGGPRPGWHDYAEALRHPEPFFPEHPTSADDVAFCYFTSGTTSTPKLVAHTHSSYPIGHLSGMYWSGLCPGDRHLNVSSPGWAKHSWSSLFVPWNAEATIVVLPSGPVRAERLPGLLELHRVTSFCAAPSTWRAMCPHLASARPPVREAVSAGEPMDARISDDVERIWGLAIRDGYGQTETTGLIGTTPGMPGRRGWLGRALPGYDIQLRDPVTGRVGPEGEICVRLDDHPAGLMSGYLSADGGLERLPGGWYGTGDVGEMDAGGWVRVHGRLDDVFKSFDRRISPYELETVLREHPAVAEVAVVPRLDRHGDTVPHAVVECSPAARSGGAPDQHHQLETALLAHVAARVTPELRVRSVEFVPRLPRTASGKIRRAAVRPSNPIPILLEGQKS